MVRQGAKIEWVWTATGIVTGEALWRWRGTSDRPIENGIAFEERIKITMKYWVWLTGKIIVSSFKRQTPPGQGLCWGDGMSGTLLSDRPVYNQQEDFPSHAQRGRCIPHQGSVDKTKTTHQLDTDFKNASIFPLCNQTCCCAPDVASAQPPLLQVPLPLSFFLNFWLLWIKCDPLIQWCTINLPNAVTL